MTWNRILLLRARSPVCECMLLRCLARRVPQCRPARLAAQPHCLMRAFAAPAASDQSCTFVAISDTHNRHEGLSLPPGDVLLHAGDCTLRGSLAEAASFADWWHAQPHAQKVVIAGNHDFCFDAQMASREEEKERAARGGTALHVAAAALLHRPERGSFYLLDSGVRTSRGGFTVYGAPYQPQFWGAFNLPVLSEALAAVWARIPAGTDVVLTHGPAAGFLDFVPRVGRHVGCSLLTQELLGRVRPAVSVCGHIHEGYGVAFGHGGGEAQQAPTTFVNAASCTLAYEPDNAPLVFTLTRRAGGGVDCVVHGQAMDEQQR